MSHQHIFLICTAAYGHLNPSIQLANNLTRAGARVTLSTTVSGINSLKSLPSISGLSFSFFSDGHDDDINAPKLTGYRNDLKRLGSESLARLIHNLTESGDPVTLLVYCFFLPWAAVVARELNVPSALFLIQSATSFSIYSHFCNSHDGIVSLKKHNIDTSFCLNLPGLPLFKWGDLPTNLLSTSSLFFDIISICQEHMQVLEEDPNSRGVLVNTLDGLELDSMRSIANAVVIGPLVSSSLSNDHGSYFQWLDSKPENSVVYVSFGSMVMLTKTQKEEVLHGLIESSRPFLLVLRDLKIQDEDVEINELKNRMGDNGLIVEWCSQMEVLRHRAIGCFVTHCGWNSTLESIVAGVAVVACPHFSDQTTNAKMVDEVWGNGVRAVADEAKVVRREEIKRCLEVVMDGGDRADEIKNKVEKWKMMARESVKDGGSTQTNLQLFLKNIS